MTDKKNRRVVVTGLGVLAPNGHGLDAFEKALRNGDSGIRRIEKLAELSFRCQVAGVPQGIVELVGKYFTDEERLAINEVMTFAGIAAIDAWKDAGFALPPSDSEANWDAGCVLGSGLSGIDTVADILVPKVNAGQVRRLGSSVVERTMASSLSAKLSGILALGNQVTSNSSACNTGTEAVHDAYHRIRSGYAERMLAGGSESSSPFVWAGFDSMRVLNYNHNDQPQQASRPLSASAGGFIPGSGAGVLLLESLESAQARGARIYAEILSAVVNCGGHRSGGSMTAPNSESVKRCIRQALVEGGVKAEQVSAINGHLTATMADPVEVKNWAAALGLPQNVIPPINSTKSLIGHCLGAAGAIECVAVVLQLYKGFLHGSLNCEDIHPEIEPFAASVVHETRNVDLSVVAKASFGFGDVNGCVIFRKWV